jgi:hypothetical protein
VTSESRCLYHRGLAAHRGPSPWLAASGPQAGTSSEDSEPLAASGPAGPLHWVTARSRVSISAAALRVEHSRRDTVTVANRGPGCRRRVPGPSARPGLLLVLVTESRYEGDGGQRPGFTVMELDPSRGSGLRLHGHVGAQHDWQSGRGARRGRASKLNASTPGPRLSNESASGSGRPGGAGPDGWVTLSQWVCMYHCYSAAGARPGTRTQTRMKSWLGGTGGGRGRTITR